MKRQPERTANEAADRVQERTTPPTPVIYETVRRLGEEEMSRPATSLVWSGIAAGVSMSFSLLAEAVLHLHLPDADWRELVVALGYPIGFVMVVLGRQQLFTENTITVVLPIMARPSAAMFMRAARLWGLVLAANLAGTLIAAAFITLTPVVDDDLRGAMLELSRRAVGHPWLAQGFRGITAGFLMAAMVWLLPSAESSQFNVVALLTYVIGITGSAHIVAGSVSSFLLLMSGDVSIGAMLAGFMLPVLVGNIVGGSVLFAAISHAQVMKEI
jgi:formate-nitrite transporter family protein